MQYRRLGQTGFQVSEVGFGSWAIGGDAHGRSYGPTDDDTALAALRQAYALGCNFFDTADLFGHGHAEQLLGRALTDWPRDAVFVCTQGGQDFRADTLARSGDVKPNFSDTYLNQAVEGSLRRLGVEYIDLYLLQAPPLAVIQHGGVFDTLRKLKQAGKIRFYGVSIHDPQEGIQAIQIGQVDAIHAVYNLFDTRIESRLLPLCAEQDVAVVIREPLARGFLAGRLQPGVSFPPGDVRAVWPSFLVNKRIEAANRFKTQLNHPQDPLAPLALRYVLSHPTVSTVVPGCKTPAHVLENFAAAGLPPLSTEQLAAIQAIQRAL